MQEEPVVPGAPDRRLTYEVFLLPDDGRRHELDLVKVFARQDDGSFPRTAELSRERADVLTTRLLPGLSIQSIELFAE